MKNFKSIWNRSYKSSKVPQITLLFWLTKLITTGLGESVSDYSVRHLSTSLMIGSVLTLAWSAVFFFGFLYLAMRAKRYLPAPYWLTVALLAVFGTFISDAIRVGLGIPLAVITGFWFILLLASLAAMRLITGSLSIHQIKTGKAEFLYWLTVGLSFVMGTSLGDYLANAKSIGGLGLGALSSGLLLLLPFVVLLAYRFFGQPKIDGIMEVATFWLAYVLTRPIGASFADYFGREFLGHGIGVLTMMGIWLILFIPFFVYNVRFDKN